MEVRFTIKGNKEETVFSPIQDKDGKYFLYTKNIQEQGDFIPLDLEEETRVFKLKDYNLFEETKEVIDERLLGLFQEWIETKASGFDADGESDPDIKKPGYSPEDIFVENKP